MMKIFMDRWDEFRCEFFPLLNLIIFQPWLHLKLPLFARLDFPLNIIVCMLMTAGSISIYCTMFLYPELYAPTYNLEWLDDAPNPDLLKKIFRMTMVLILCSIVFYTWSTNYYQLSNADYVLLFTHASLNWIFMVRIMKKYNNKMQSTSSKF